MWNGVVTGPGCSSQVVCVKEESDLLFPVSSSSSWAQVWFWGDQRLQQGPLHQLTTNPLNLRVHSASGYLFLFIRLFGLEIWLRLCVEILVADFSKSHLFSVPVCCAWNEGSGFIISAGEGHWGFSCTLVINICKVPELWLGNAGCQNALSCQDTRLKYTAIQQ